VGQRKKGYTTLDLGFSKDYTEGFFAQDSNNETAYGNTIYNILETEEQFQKPIYKWQELEIVAYLKKFEMISINSVNLKLNVLRHFSNYIYEQEEIQYGREYGVSNQMECIDMQKLLSVTISESEYQVIKNQMNFTLFNRKINVRDKLILSLAWLGLNSNEIKNIKERDIVFKGSERDEVVIIHMIDGSELTVNNAEIIKDLKTVLIERYYYVECIDDRINKVPYRDTEYLLKPARIKRARLSEQLANPSLVLQKVFVEKEIKCEGIDIARLSIEDIRRSKIISLLRTETFEYIKELFDIKSETSLWWLKRISKEKYPDS